ncbi:MAG: chemotaxis response regulator protein-glutamate methylesterase [Spartobacteria bacterium]|nr:chemotaxis response regulator protein-glutamate methylesterase [Spartobacteria bacterium]
MTIRALVADDSTLFRRVLTDVLNAIPDVEVVGSASNGVQAVEKIKALQPDLVTLDIEMPQMDGIAVLDALDHPKDIAVIVVSALTLRGGHLTMRALEKGAFDFITKPETGGLSQSKEAITEALTPRIKALANRLQIRSILRGASGKKTVESSSRDETADVDKPKLSDVASRMSRVYKPSQKPEMVLIGVSTGGPNALAKLIPSLPGTLGVPVLIVQHMPPVFTKSLAQSLASKSALTVVEAENGMTLESNTVYIAPGGLQMKVGVDSLKNKVIQIKDDPPENNCRPAVDYLFRSVAMQFPGRAMAVILTGMGADGTIGLKLLKRGGCFVLGQDEDSCVVYGMPRAAAEAGVVDVVLPLEDIAGRIVSAVHGMV